jgi:hypothetical protein
VITANNVFAHSDALGAMADGIRQLLSADGVFIFEVSYLVDIVDKLLFDTIYHEHLCYHSLKPLDRFLREHGLELFDVTRTPSKGGSIRCFAQHLGGGRGRTPAVPALLALEEQMGLDGLEVYRRLTARIESLKRELLGLLGDLTSQGRTIAGYGASATVTTLLYHFELGPYLSYLVDDNPERHGLLSPGQHLPVLPPQTLLDRNTDYAVILAWQYATPILDRNRPFRQQGGRFVLPLPRVQVIPPLNSDTPHA